MMTLLVKMSPRTEYHLVNIPLLYIMLLSRDIEMYMKFISIVIYVTFTRC